MEKLIITAAITGSVTMPTQTQYLPITPKEIADEAVRAAEAGAASVHIHARDPKDGKPSADLDVFREILTNIKAKTDAIIGTTTGGLATMTAEERVRVVPHFKPELASFNMGTMNFSMHPLASRYKDEEYKFPWEKELLLMSKDMVFKNTFADLEHLCNTMKNNGTKPECEVYDVGHLYSMAFMVKAGFIQPPLWIQFVTGILGGISSTIDDVLHLKRTADRLFNTYGYRWSVIGAGYPQEFQLATLGIMTGGHVRVGIEDNIYVKKGVLAKSNTELVEKVVRIAGELDREIATPAEARAMLGLKGKGNVNF